LGVERVEGERGFPGPGHTRDDDERVARQAQVDVLEVVLGCALDRDPIGGHGVAVTPVPVVARAVETSIIPAAGEGTDTVRSRACAVPTSGTSRAKSGCSAAWRGCPYPRDGSR